MSVYYRTKKYRAFKRELKNESIENDIKVQKQNDNKSDDILFSDITDAGTHSQNYEDQRPLTDDAVIIDNNLHTEDLKNDELLCIDENFHTNEDITFNQDSNLDDTIDTDYSSNSSEECDEELEYLSENNPQQSLSDAKKIEDQNLRISLQVWAIKYRKNLTRKCIDDLLKTLKNGGVNNIPESSSILLPSQSTSDFDVKVMESSRGKLGCFAYFGLTERLKKIIDPSIFVENTISILVNVDGVQVFQKSREQLWPILGMIDNKDYKSAPFIIAVFGGNAKPGSAEEYFQQFVEEMNSLISNGIKIGNTFYTVKFQGFVCDTPARAFIKGCKGHTGFNSCERCETRGITINRKRIFPKVDSKLRTNESFRNKRQSDHHVTDCYLLKLINFDPIRHVFLDSMHLLSEGGMKYCMEEWFTTKKRIAKLSVEKRNKLSALFKSASTGIPIEFQRKTLDTDNLQYWKATQFRFVLLYCSAIVLKHVLNCDAYKHFMLYFVACRILCSSELAVKHKNYAKSLLENFFILMPTFFGEDCQKMNNHNLLHVADDVEHVRKCLSDFTAFPFENCLGLLKALIKGRKDIVPQLIKRISEIENCPELSPEFKLTVNYPVQRKQKDIILEYKNKSTKEIQSVLLKETKIRTVKPDNTILLNNGTFFEVISISKNSENMIFVEGYTMENLGNSFDYPCDSTLIGIWKIGPKNTRKVLININEIKEKCIVLEIENENHAVSFLHVE